MCMRIFQIQFFHLLKDMATVLAHLMPGPKVLLPALFFTTAAALALRNITLAVPDGASNHGDSNQLCTTTTFGDIVIFYFGNYFAHVATIKSLPGERITSMVIVSILALLFPASGMARGLLSIISCAKFAKTDFQAAARASALCMVVRSHDWRPKDGDKVRNCLIWQHRAGIINATRTGML